MLSKEGQEEYKSKFQSLVEQYQEQLVECTTPIKLAELNHWYYNALSSLNLEVLNESQSETD